MLPNSTLLFSSSTSKSVPSSDCILHYLWIAAAITDLKIQHSNLGIEYCFSWSMLSIQLLPKYLRSVPAAICLISVHFTTMIIHLNVDPGSSVLYKFVLQTMLYLSGRSPLCCSVMYLLILVH